MILTELAVGLGRVMASQLKGASNAVLYSLRFLEDPDEDTGDDSPDEPPYGPIGWYGRPLPPVSTDDETGNNPAGECEVIAAKVADRAYPHGFRDLRINAKTNPKEGEVGIGHYLGGLVSLKLNDTGDGTDVTIYAPHQDGSGSPDKAHVLTMNTTTADSNVQLVHSYGHRVSMNKTGGLILSNKAGDAYIEVNDDGVTLNGNMNLVGAADIGGDGLAPVGDLVMLSTKLLAWIAQVDTALSTLASHAHGGVTTGTGACSTVVGVTAPSASPEAATNVKAT